MEKYRARLDRVSARLTTRRVGRRGQPPRRPHGPAAGRAAPAHLQRGRALHHRARGRGPADRDAARGDGGRRDGRARRARPRLRRRRLRGGARRDARGARRALPTRSFSTSAASPSCSATTARTNTHDFHVAPRGYRALGRIPRLPRLVAQKVDPAIRRPRGDPRGRPTTELAAVDGVGEARAGEIREGLDRLAGGPTSSTDTR